MRGTPLIALLLAAAATSPLLGGAVLDPRDAPEWKVSEWLNGDPGQLDSHKGQVVVIHFFQMWCPGCNNFSIPALQRWDELWGERDDYLAVSIHSVFEGYPFQTPELLRNFVHAKGLRHPVGVDAFLKEGETVPVTMQRFSAQGTPHLVIVNKEGKLVFSHFGVFDSPTVEYYIERLLKEESDVKPPPKPDRPDETLSGSYELSFEQVSKSCGPLEPPREMVIQLEIQKRDLVADFPHRFMGLGGLSLRYDPVGYVFEGVLVHKTEVRGDPVEAEARIRGHFVMGSNPPELEYEVSFRRTSENIAWNCDVQARGRAVRTDN